MYISTLPDYVQRLVDDLKDDKKYRFFLRYNPTGDYFNILIFYPNKLKLPTVITIPGNDKFRDYTEFLLTIKHKLECLL